MRERFREQRIEREQDPEVLGRVREETDRAFRSFLSWGGSGETLRDGILERVRRFGIRAEHVQVGVSEGAVPGKSVTLKMGTRESRTTDPASTSSVHRLMLAGVLMTGCGGRPDDDTRPEFSSPPSVPVPAEMVTPQTRTQIVSSGSRSLDPELVTLDATKKPKEIEGLPAPECGPLKPQNAPIECQQQQWLGYSEHNPVAVAWMALANTGEETCTVKITSLALSYRVAGEKESTLLTHDINGVQLLADGTDGAWWGKYVQDIDAGSTFEIPANAHAYVHPFGPMAVVPLDATELTVTFSAEMTDGCIVSGGMDTYSEHRIPTTEPPYTQNGSPTDFIKEAMKTPWVKEDIDPKTPVSFSIKHVPSK